MKTCTKQLLSWSQLPKPAFHGFSPRQHFCPIKEQGQFTVIRGIKEEPHYPRVRMMVRIKPWAPWVMANCYKTGKETLSKQLFNLQQKQKPKSKDKKKKKINIQPHQNILCQNSMKTAKSPYTTLLIPSKVPK